MSQEVKNPPVVVAPNIPPPGNVFVQFADDAATGSAAYQLLIDSIVRPPPAS